jgi:hypothetical protein
MAKHHRRHLKWLCLGLWLLAHPAAAITLQVDYTYDTTLFFGSGNPQGSAGGAQARAALESAANFYSAILTDTFDAIIVPGPYHSVTPGSTGLVTWSWQESFQHPSDPSENEVRITNPVVGTDQYVIYAGARALSGTTAGIGGPGGFSRPAPTVSGSGFNQTDQNNVNSMTANFDQLIKTRGESSGFANWGGTIAFDNDGTTSWFFNHLASPSGNVTDFYSIAIHELGHTLGFGASTDWQALVSGAAFFGANAEALNSGNPVPLSTPDLAHWANGTSSVVYGTSTSQETAMDPELQNGTRKRLTELDAAGLKDIGWTLGPVPGVNGDYNNNGKVDAADYVRWRDRLGQSFVLPNDTTPGTVTQADYTVWRNNFGASLGSGSGSAISGAAIPEPAAAVSITLGGILLSVLRLSRVAKRHSSGS